MQKDLRILSARYKNANVLQTHFVTSQTAASRLPWLQRSPWEFLQKDL
jgi:hypothetical protein